MRVSNVIGLLVLLLLAGCRGESGHPGGGNGGSRKPASRYKVWGLDISKHQAHVDWARIKANDCPDFVFVKATEGTLIVDPTFERHAKELDDAGIPWGAYHFFGHRTPGKEQAKNFLRVAKPKKGNMVPVLDIEKHRFMTDPARSVREAKAFCKEVKRKCGREPIIYCSTLFYESYLKKDFPANEYILWIADYRGNPSHLDWHFWQHTDSHSIRGIRGKVDRNVYGGDADTFQKLILQ